MNNPAASATPLTTTNQHNIYDRVFWLAYLANILAVMANALTFRFAELVHYLGGNEQTTGNIVSVGLIVAVLARLVLSSSIDYYGTRLVWTLCSALFTGGSLVFLLATGLGWPLYVARAAFYTGLTGMFACSMTHIQNHVPLSRRTEVIGNLGSSGFVGMIIGSNIADQVVRWIPDLHEQFYALFGGAAGIGLVYLLLIRQFPQTGHHEPMTEPQSAVRLLYRYWPGAVVLAAMMMGLGQTVTTVFLTRFATERGLNGIAIFFSAYAISAFCFRISVRNWGWTIGRRWMLFRGLMGQTAGHLMIPFVMEDWQLLIPAIICGFGHAILFPAVVSLGAGAFPISARGTGTAIILGMTDLGGLVFAPFLGRIIDEAGFFWMFATSASSAFLVGCLYLVVASRHPDEESRHGQVNRPDRIVGP
ncbi:MFS transporter [Planctopirus hydrillae]|uniref:MFS transporter n=1 Tax=Planctopirus hydrillae TaxID=1841610 RepID=A0A1C3EQF9_9PLAN|nr:MFS transporter [Planctopirus hydrillae]ODA35474.1 MFS transporter [Planctopirus hydrillae]